MIGATALGPQAVMPRGQNSILVTSGQALVRLSSGTAATSLDPALAALGATRGVDLGGGWHLIHLSTGQSVSSALPALRALPGVTSADPSRVYSTNRMPNDPLINSQYALSQVAAYAGWEYGVGASSRVTIAVIDTGIDGTHPDLTGKLTNTASKAFDPNSGVMTANNPPTPACNHATHVGGVAAASTDNGVQVAGVSWGAQLLSLKVFTDASCPSVNCTDAGCRSNDPGIAAAINHAVTLQNTAAVGRMVINISLGAASGGVCPAGVVQTAITNAVNAGIPVVVSAGNDGGDVQTPANCTGAIPVGATDSLNNIAAFSSRGPTLASNGLVAPGVSLATTEQGGGTTNATGTSFASPMVAGLAALILSEKPSLGADAAGVGTIKAVIRGGADQIGVSALGAGVSGDSAGAGRMDVFRSMRLAINGTLAGFDGESKPIAFPNPFKPAENGQVTFAVPPSLQGLNQTIKIYTLDGQLVKSLNTLSWNGKNTEGTNVASGTYVFVVSSNAGTARGRFSVLR